MRILRRASVIVSLRSLRVDPSSSADVVPPDCREGRFFADYWDVFAGVVAFEISRFSNQ